MKLVIMRHGEAEPYSQSVADDQYRRLTPRGMQQATKAGQCLLESGLVFEQIWASPYQRTQQTASCVASSFNGQAFSTVDCITPEVRPSIVIDAIGASGAQSLLIISHQPLVGSLVSQLTGQDIYSVPAMAPASLVMLQAEDVLPGCCEMLWHRHSPDFSLAY